MKKKIPFPLKIDLTQKKQGFGLLFIGVLVALVVGTLAHTLGWDTTWIWWMVALGVVIGILNIFHDEGVLFVLTLLTLTFMLDLLVSLAIYPPRIAPWIVTPFNGIIYLLAPVAVVVGLKVLYALALK